MSLPLIQENKYKLMQASLPLKSNYYPNENNDPAKASMENKQDKNPIDVFPKGGRINPGWRGNFFS